MFLLKYGFIKVSIKIFSILIYNQKNRRQITQSQAFKNSRIMTNDLFFMIIEKSLPKTS